MNSAASPAAAGMERRRLTGAGRRSQIVATARRLFAERGYDATTTREIAAASGISEGLIYRHFSGKDALLGAVIDDGIARFSALGPPAGVDRRQVPLEDLLLGLGRAFLAAVGEQLDLIKLLISQQHLLTQDRRFVEFIDGAASNLGALIDHHHPADDGEPGRGYLIARGYMGSLVALALLQHALGLQAVRPVDEGTYLRVMVGTLVDGLRPRGVRA